ncbi:MAG TPA: sigma-70 family RNA polymerase sigma factor [Acidimicrobiales bacterium]|nr:sigma-70 family RNA polymerase sigma factor [Acidimicrobiales bacterium]
MTTAALAREMRRCRQALARSAEASDQARTLLTVPADRVERHWLAGGASRPAVDPDLWRLHVRYDRDRDEDALQALVERYRPHAEAQARRHYRRGEPIDDLTQVAYEALMLALQRFDPDRRKPFLAFAKPTIVGSLRRHFRDAGWAMRVPRRVHELASPVRDAQELLTHDLGRAPSPGEIADFIGVEEREVLDSMRAEEVRATTSLDAPDPASGLQAEQVIGRLDRGFVGIENRTALLQSLELLSGDDRELLQMYFVEERTQSQIAEVLGCSQMQVSRLLRRAVRQLRRHMVGS